MLWKISEDLLVANLAAPFVVTRDFWLMGFEFFVNVCIWYAEIVKSSNS